MNNRFWHVLLIIVVAGVAGCSKKNKPFTLDQAQGELTTEDALDIVDPQLIFLHDHAAQTDVIIRASGLQLKILKKGDGAIPTLDSIVTAHYHGTLIDGTIFDSTRDTGQPFSFTLESVIDGWKEAMMLMRVGSIFEIVLPADMAYGNVGAGDLVPPGATLIFEVELVDVTNPLNPSN